MGLGPGASLRISLSLLLCSSQSAGSCHTGLFRTVGPLQAGLVARLWTLSPVIGGIIAMQWCPHVLIPGTCGYVALHGKRYFAGLIKLKV